MNTAAAHQPEPGTPVIQVRDLHRIYTVGTQEVPAIRGVDLDVGRGEYVAIMGSSGSGKSTFIEHDRLPGHAHPGLVQA